MLENNRDEINFHKFLKSVRNAQDVSLEQVAIGVCSKSGMSRVEAGTRLPDKLVRDRLTARLGISGEEYEEYLLPREYKQWEHRMEIIRCINKNDIAGAEEKIEAYGNAYDTNQVDIQFVEAMKFMVMEMKSASEDELYAQVSEALECTVLDMDAALDGVHLLADQELNLIMEYIRLKQDEIPGENATEWRLKEYHKIVTYVENSHMDKIAQAKVYSKLACFVSELILTNHVKEESLRYALELCTRAIEVLRDTVRLYYFVELNEYRKKLIEKLREIITGADVEEFEELYRTSEEWATLFHEMYTENELPIYMENFTHLYTETECNNVCDVIRARRAMMGMNREKFCGSACDEKTLYRIEKGICNPTMAVVRDLFERTGLCAEYKRARVITSDARAIYLSQNLFELMDNYKHEEASECLNILYKSIDMDIPHNEQTLKRQELTIAERSEKFNYENYTELLTDILECTLSIDALISDGDKYFTIIELECIHDFAAYTTGKVQAICRNIIEKMCLGSKDTILDISNCCIYELFMNRMASIYGDEKAYEESNIISNKLLKESLCNRKMFALTSCIYNNLWNYQQMKNYDKDDILKILYKLYVISTIAKLDNWKDFLQQRIEEISID